ncbi:MAG: CRISPR-associated helicase Cas3' [Methyloversatilis sp.]|uniref:CRISPR-associated helicase Cas3' n=1 Tax=Methyloversatilis sp. TaxID=2569862 RepID=UPI0027339D16|nr:CRISPR-associated helicase Cas3' [Methyloversatilis sp.]MDP3872858.1 CRISPR-associated helicase Cas3' [Methyloversatilis sp.]
MHQELTAVSAFGKLERSPDEIGWHPLVDHMADVAAVFEALCACERSRRSLEAAAARALDDRDVARLAAVVFLHDLGKANAGFQAKRWADAERPRDWLTAGHGAEAIALLEASNHNEEAEALLLRLPILDICAWGKLETLDSLLRASIAHHGRPIAQAPDWFNARIHWIAHHGYDPATQLTHIGTAIKRFLPDAFLEGGLPLPDAPRFAHYFAGLVQLSDWLGSDRRFFPFSEDGENRLATSRERARIAVSDIGLEADRYRLPLRRTPPAFADVFDAPAAYPSQAAMSNDALGPVVVLEAETGSGKTEAALWRYFHLLARGDVDGLYFALPTRVAATQVYRRVCDALTRAWRTDAPVAVRALSGYAAADGETPKSLPDFKVLWSDEPSDAEAGRRWACENAKRFLAAPVAVGTVDQVLLGTLQVKHAHMRHALAARSLVVIDEVHASDAYMAVLIERLIAAQVALGGHVLLLSATLGAAARVRYLAAGTRKAPQFPSLTQAIDLPYPAISDFAGLRATSGAKREKVVAWQCDDSIDVPQRVATVALEAAAQGARVLVIRNTVPAAIATLAALEAATPCAAWLFHHAGVVTLHHSRFSREDRPKLDAAIEAALGKGRSSGPLVVVGTQTLEQSLDLDADFLITDLCPMDVLLQRIGRLHRHIRPTEARPAAFREARVLVLTPAGGDLEPCLARPRHGLGRFRDGGGVYPDARILEATRRQITSELRIRIPADNRRLVESAMHPESLRAMDALGEAWESHGRQIDGDTGARRTSAKLGLLPLETAFSELAFPNEVKLATRLGAADRIVVFDPPLPGPFGNSVRELPIRHHLLPAGLALEVEPKVEATEPGSFAFSLGEARYRYSRLGLERLSQAAPQE